MHETTFRQRCCTRPHAVARGASALDLDCLESGVSLALRARARRRSKKPRIRFVPSRAPVNQSGTRADRLPEKMEEGCYCRQSGNASTLSNPWRAESFVGKRRHSSARADPPNLARAIDKITALMARSERCLLRPQPLHDHLRHIRQSAPNPGYRDSNPASPSHPHKSP